jgi:hypothetical protein
VAQAGHDLRLRARGGRYLLDLLGQRGMGKWQAALVQALAFTAPATGANDEEAVFVRRMIGRVPDGKRALELTGTKFPELAKQLNMPANEQAIVQTALTDFMTWYRPRAGEVTGATWNETRLEYDFGVMAQLTPNITCALAAPGYRGGRLDWDAFRLNALVPMPGPSPSTTTYSVMPAPVTFPGKPATRFWEMEDARVDLGNVDAGPGDVGRIVLVEFALLWANDWFTVPVPVEQTGTLLRVESLVVTDTFGVKTKIKSAYEVRSDPAFQLFRLSGPPEQTTNLLFVPPVLPGSIIAAPIEEVTILRDEAANLAWASERVVPGALGRPTRRTTPAAATAPAAPLVEASSAPTDVARAAPSYLEYQPMQPPSPGWIPLAPVLPPQQSVVHLQRAEVVDPAAAPAAPRGAFLQGNFMVRGDEVPREGLTLRRRYEVARAQNGTLHLWITREKQPGTGDFSSGVRFDLLREKPIEPDDV